MELTTGFEGLGKRSRNAAVKRIGLLDALLSRLAERPLPAITVRELCDEVGIVEQTFFNTFGGKPALLIFYVMLWSIEMQWRMDRTECAEEALRLVFVEGGEQMQETPWLMPEIIIHQVRAHADELPSSAPPTPGDKLLRFRDMPGAEALEPLPIQHLIGNGVRRAVDDGELPAEMDQELLTRLLCGLFFGAAASSREPSVVAEILVRGFDALWLASCQPKETTR